MADLPDNFLAEPQPHLEAADWLRSKPVVSREVFERLLPELQARAFLITGLEAHDELQGIRDLIAEVPLGEDWDQAKAAIAERLGPHLTQLDKDGRPDPDATRKASEARAQLLLRTHGFQAYALSQHQVMQRQTGAFPYWQYLSLDDAKVRPTHRALDGIVLPADSPFWADHSPPWEWGCRCRKVPLTEAEVEDLRQEDQAKPREERLVLDEAQRRDLEDSGLIRRAVRDDQGKLVRDPMLPWGVLSPRNRGDDSPFVFDPESFTMPLDQLLDRYDPATRRDFEAWARRSKLKDGRTVWSWLGGAQAPVKPKPKPKPQPAPAPAPGPTPEAYKPRKLADIHKALDETLKEWDEADAELRKLAATPAANLQPGAMAAAVERRKAATEAAREAASIAESMRGKVKVDPGDATTKAAKAMVNFEAGRGIVERFTAPGLLPKIKVKVKEGRAYQHHGTIVGGKTMPASTVAHEITHATEIQTKATLRRSSDFLLSRRKGKEKGKRLSTLTKLRGYSASEIAFEDEWVTKGGSHYSGKLYFPGVGSAPYRKLWKALLESDPKAAMGQTYATELLTMGIERLHENPLKFRREDREYFDFVLTTLQQLEP